jgi:hypothetical protein
MLNHSQIADFVELTLAKYMRGSWEDITPNYNDNEFVSRTFKNNQVPEDGGRRLEWKVQVDRTGNARLSGLYDEDRSTVKNIFKAAYTEWSKQTTNYSYDIDEHGFQGSMEEIIDLLEGKEHDMYSDWFDFMLEQIWSDPASEYDEFPILGYRHWIQKNDSDAGGFTGANPAGWSTGRGSLSSTTYPNWKNWVDHFTDVTRTDFVRKVLEATKKTQFRTTHNFKEIGKGPPDWCMYTGWTNWELLKELQESRNENHGTELGWMDGNPIINGVAIYFCSALDGGVDGTGPAADSENPLYGINHRKMKWVFKRGRNQIRSKPLRNADSHTVFTVHVDNWGQMKCTNPRSHFVIYNPA